VISHTPRAQTEDGHRRSPSDGPLVQEWTSEQEWDAFVDRATDGTIAHVWGWRSAIERAYGHPSVYLAAVGERGIRGVLPLTLVRSRLLGRHLVSMPFLDYGGICTDGDHGVERALIDAALDLAGAERARLELRHFGERSVALPTSTEKVTMLLDLDVDADVQFRRLSSERRNRIRKGVRSGVSATVHGADGLDAFYDVWSENMRTLGSPPHARAFFREILTALEDRARILLVQAEDGVTIGAALMLRHGAVLSIPWVSSLRRFFHLCPNQILYWEAIRFAIDEGIQVLDFGRSSKGTGTFEAKRQWGAEPVQLSWHYFPEGDGPPGLDAGRFEWAARIWRHLPMPIVDRLGPALRKGIPN
jgi:FemAB-related protein (PEP-CTERM system-associated)